MKSFAVEVINASWVLSGKTRLEAINLQIRTGSCCAIMGPNGCGKSSLLALLSGYIWPSQGQIRIFHQNLGEVSVQTIRKSMGLVEPSRCPAFPTHYTTREIVATGLFGTVMLPLRTEVSPPQWSQVDQEIIQLGLEDQRKHQFQSLSSGEKMKTLLARALVGAPQLLLLDEPTAGLDMGTRAAFVHSMECIGSRPTPPTMIIVSHHLDELPKHMDHVVLMKSGRIVTQGSPDQTLTNANLSDLFDCPMSVLKHEGRFIATVTTRDA